MNVWIDIDNPPGTRYLLPLARRFQQRGLGVVLTARDYGETFTILRDEKVPFRAVGSAAGKSKARKAIAVLVRGRELRRCVRDERPAFVIGTSRAAAFAARTLGIPSFAIIDYEYVNLSLYRLAGTHVLHPDVIRPDVFRQGRLPLRQLVPFSGLKEDLSFAGVDVSAVGPYDLGTMEQPSIRVLFRPPAEESHYYARESSALARALLRHLADANAQVVLAPRYSRQVHDLEAATWKHEPIVLRKPAPFVPLLKAVDAVVSAGGTMLREAAFLGVPAYSVFKSRIGAVDRHLADIGRLVLLSSADDFRRLRLERRPALSPLRTGYASVDEVVEKVLAAAG